MTILTDWDEAYSGYVPLSDGRIHQNLTGGYWLVNGRWIVRSNYSVITQGQVGRVDVIWADSLDGPWNAALPFGFSAAIQGVGYGNGLWMATTSSTAGSTHAVATSPDMITWTSRGTIAMDASPATVGWLNYVGGAWVYVSRGSSVSGGAVYAATSHTGPWSKIADFRSLAGDTTGEAFAASVFGTTLAVVATGNGITRLWQSDTPAVAGSWVSNTIANYAFNGQQDPTGFGQGGLLNFGLSASGFFVGGTDNLVYTADTLAGPWSLYTNLSTVLGATISGGALLGYNDAEGWLVAANVSNNARIYSGPSLYRLDQEQGPIVFYPGTTYGLLTNGDEWLLGKAVHLYTRAAAGSWGIALA